MVTGRRGMADSLSRSSNLNSLGPSPWTAESCPIVQHVPVSKHRVERWMFGMQSLRPVGLLTVMRRSCGPCCAYGVLEYLKDFTF